VRPLALLRVDGGLTRSRVLMQMQADLLQIPVEVAASPHATAAGVGALARIGSGAARTLDDAVRWDEPDARYEPVMGAAEADERLAGFERAVAHHVRTSSPPSPSSP
jgi:glycerol kinase